MKPTRPAAKRRRRIDGILLLDKPLDVSSNRALQRARNAIGALKAGHTGSLDPAATGLLPLTFGEATKVSAFLLDADKRYSVTALFGEARSTGDREGNVTATGPVPDLDASEWTRALAGFEGEQWQIPPMYSALKKDGQPLYKLARAGKVVEREARRIDVRQCRYDSHSGDTLQFTVCCSKGTYIRALVEDIAAELGTVAYTAGLRRTALGPFDLGDAIPLDEVEAAGEALIPELLPPDRALAGWPAVTLDAGDERRFCEGQAVSNAASAGAGSGVRVYGACSRFLGVGVASDDGLLAPKRLFRMARNS